MALVITTDILSSYMQAALERAAQHRKAGRIPQLQADGSYLVPSATSDQVYVVRIQNLTELRASCSCAHGTRGDAKGYCWHSISAMAEEVRRLGGKYKIKSRPAPQPAPSTIAKPAPRPQLPPAAVTEAENAAAVARLFPRAA